ncbi:unnamed protein product [Candida verbasci]|uniref:Large ribosomal subunit protein mL54 n=1 Tax=Candida verbasci TaxID=1227364 RepID=A0A9W4TVI8_9ASCO|nr:unnamed protein product [Candida verbasci]
MLRLRPIVVKRSFNISSILNQSSCKSGTVLNLKIYNKGDEPIAKDDSEYPDWLWNMLDKTKSLNKIKDENFLRWRRIKLSKENGKKIRQNNFVSKI